VLLPEAARACSGTAYVRIAGYDTDANRARITIGGPRAVHGRLLVRSRRVRGRIGGRRVNASVRRDDRLRFYIP
jgi:hypothetical protein